MIDKLSYLFGVTFIKKKSIFVILNKWNLSIEKAAWKCIKFKNIKDIMDDNKSGNEIIIISTWTHIHYLGKCSET